MLQSSIRCLSIGTRGLSTHTKMARHLLEHQKLDPGVLVTLPEKFSLGPKEWRLMAVNQDLPTQFIMDHHRILPMKHVSRNQQLDMDWIIPLLMKLDPVDISKNKTMTWEVLQQLPSIENLDWQEISQTMRDWSMDHKIEAAMLCDDLISWDVFIHNKMTVTEIAQLVNFAPPDQKQKWSDTISMYTRFEELPKYFDILNWDIVTERLLVAMANPSTERHIFSYQNFINWDIFLQSPYFEYLLPKCPQDKLKDVDWSKIIKSGWPRELLLKVPETTLSVWAKHLRMHDQHYLMKNRKLSIDFLLNHRNSLSASIMSTCQDLTESEMDKLGHWLIWKAITRSQKMSNQFVWNHRDHLDWEWLSENNNFSKKFRKTLRKHKYL